MMDWNTPVTDEHLNDDRTWIVPKDCYRCYHCEGVDNVIRRGRMVKIECDCKSSPRVGLLDTYIEARRCKTCPDVRKVKVKLWRGMNGQETEHAEDHCAACKTERATASHLYQYQRLSKKAREMRAALVVKKGAA